MFSLPKTAAEAIAVALCVLIVADPTCSLKRFFPQHAFMLRLSRRLHYN
ncbi:hypothetical protein [Serratia marcescens]|nr:hypothetical protein [Serratia marcescens]CVA91562.1 Uncharacterised protein [Serratia marcescens]CVB22825.1 Uncharacterised protein [Serratia marcescens]CVB86388.1 Uncharacterised protein [Serratia marcescens]CVC10568.1 Uncharacterised protein [Serratia marcescens]CVD02366.1 Uncharacterised protein [Serratia marcescens]